MNDQGWSALIGLAVIVTLRLLDWAFPRGWVWKRVRDWSIPATKGHDDDEVKP